jgi:hypothetical protein
MRHGTLQEGRLIDQEQEREKHDEWRRSLPEDDIHRLIDSFPAWLARAGEEEVPRRAYENICKQSDEYVEQLKMTNDKLTGAEAKLRHLMDLAKNWRLDARAKCLFERELCADELEKALTG